jgi:hypothetical protein
MSRFRFRLLLIVLFALALAAGYRMIGAPTPALAAPEAAGWEYQTGSVDLGSLTPRLMELGKEGWEVINIISIDTMIDQTPDGKTHILTQRVEVTSRRPK